MPELPCPTLRTGHRCVKLLTHVKARSAGLAWQQGPAMTACMFMALGLLCGSNALYARTWWDPARQQAVEGALSGSEARTARWQKALDQLTSGFDGRVGACASTTQSTACVSGDQRFPMQSVWKLALAVAVLDAVDRGAWRLDEPIEVRRHDLSVYVQPIAKLVGPHGLVTTIDHLLRGAIVESDNAAADILLARLGGPTVVQQVLGRRAMVSIRVDRDERHLQTDINGLAWRDEYLSPAAFDRAVAAVPQAARDAAFQSYLHDDRDTATPRAMVLMLQRLTAGGLLSSASTRHLLDLLEQTTTFPDRLKAGVPEGWTIGHKTGTSGDWRGVTAATNDVGILRAPDGRFVSVAVFIDGSHASSADRSALMANIARAIVSGY
jgi:beta-lactamase class A